MAFTLSACSTLGYYAQSVDGQIDVLVHREPIARLVHDDTQPPQLRAKLETVQQIRRFASTELDLPDNDSYTSYVQLERPYAVWNVFAAPEFSLQLKEWCFPVAGCVGYRGYFTSTLRATTPANWTRPVSIPTWGERSPTRRWAGSMTPCSAP